MSQLEKHLLERGLYDTRRDMKKEILDSNETLARVSDAWATHKEAIRDVVRARLDAIRDELVLKAVPQEVLVLRQALLELGEILIDFERYHAEYERRKKPHEPSEPPVEGEPDGDNGTTAL